MRALLTRLLTCLALTLPLALPLPAAAQEAEITGIIRDQLGAFTDRDVDTAWTFASPSIQGLYGDPDTFGTMVREAFPMVWNNDETRFLELQTGEGRAIQRVLIRDDNGVAHVLDYMMSLTSNGWKISGVRLVPAPDTGV